MLRHEVTPEMLDEWKSVWSKYKDKLRPNRKSGQDILNYISEKYVLSELHDDYATQVIVNSVMMNEYFAEKLPAGKEPLAVTFIVENTGAGRKLYNEQGRLTDDIFVGIDLASGFYQVENSPYLWDELCAFQGLDEADIQNYFYVAQYIYALEKIAKPSCTCASYTV